LKAIAWIWLIVLASASLIGLLVPHGLHSASRTRETAAAAVADAANFDDGAETPTEVQPPARQESDGDTSQLSTAAREQEQYQIGLREVYSKASQESYQRGLLDGYQRGSLYGYQRGTQTGYQQGVEEGYRRGYTDGRQVGNWGGSLSGYQKGTLDGYSVGYEQGGRKRD